jgi:hypothetical protein
MEARKAEQKQLLETLQATHKAVKEAEAGACLRGSHPVWSSTATFAALADCCYSRRRLNKRWQYSAEVCFAFAMPAQAHMSLFATADYIAGMPDACPCIRAPVVL